MHTSPGSPGLFFLTADLRDLKWNNRIALAVTGFTRFRIYFSNAELKRKRISPTFTVNNPPYHFKILQLRD